VARLLLTKGWDQLEGHVDSRVGTQAWEGIENCIVPVLMRIKGEGGRPVFTKVFGFSFSLYRSLFTWLLEFLIQIVLSKSTIFLHRQLTVVHLGVCTLRQLGLTTVV
jgi:hypothetical protein